MLSSLFVEGHFVWRGLTEVAGELLAMGLHRQPSKKLPFWLSETRKRLFMCAYRSDKTMATLLGRPPRIPKLYCNVEMPFEIDDGDIMLEPDALNHVLSKLDKDGWDRNSAPRIRQTSGMRLRFQISLIREEILELSMGPSAASPGYIAQLMLVPANLPRH